MESMPSQAAQDSQPAAAAAVAEDKPSGGNFFSEVRINPAGTSVGPKPGTFPAWAEQRYRCIRRISHAADATVWLVRVLKGDGGRLHVLKELHNVDVTKRRDEDSLPREVELLTSQKHPFILPVVEMLRDASTGQVGMVTEYCDQGDLYSLLIELRRRGERVPETQVLSWLAQLCLALSHLHGQRILHRDVKTSNIFVTADRTLRLGDFGLARALQADSEAVVSRVGSPFYMSPEICLNQPYGTSSDIWSLGCVLYETLALYPAFYAESMVLVLDKICSASYKPVPDGACSAEVRELLSEMLQLQPTLRPSAQQVLQHPALRPVLRQLEPAAPPPQELHQRLAADSEEVEAMRAAPGSPSSPGQIASPDKALSSADASASTAAVAATAQAILALSLWHTRLEPLEASASHWGGPMASDAVPRFGSEKRVAPAAPQVATGGGEPVVDVSDSGASSARPSRGFSVRSLFSGGRT